MRATAGQGPGRSDERHLDMGQRELPGQLPPALGICDGGHPDPEAVEASTACTGGPKCGAAAWVPSSLEDMC